MRRYHNVAVERDLLQQHDKAAALDFGFGTGLRRCFVTVCLACSGMQKKTAEASEGGCLHS